MRSRTVREGSVGLLILLGLSLFGGLFIWLRGVRLGQTSYKVVFQFSDVYGVRLGSSVRYRGLEVGKITKIEPGSNGVDVTVEIAPADLRIPREVTVNINRSGLVGQAFIDMTPDKLLPDSAKSITPISSDCQESNLIICDGDSIQGETSVSFEQILPSTLKILKLYGSPEFYNNINSAVANASQSASELSELTQKLSVLTDTVTQEVKGFSTTAKIVVGSVNETSGKINRLADNINELFSSDGGNLAQTLNGLNQTTQEITKLAVKLQPTLDILNSSLEDTDTKQLIKNIDTFATNAAEISTNLRELSSNLNEPSSRLSLQQTLDSARVTFANTEKITSDLDELIGDPALRQNIRKLIDGLSNLVSLTEQLEQQVSVRGEGKSGRVGEGETGRRGESNK